MEAGTRVEGMGVQRPRLRHRQKVRAGDKCRLSASLNCRDTHPVLTDIAISGLSVFTLMTHGPRLIFTDGRE